MEEDAGPRPLFEVSRHGVPPAVSDELLAAAASEIGVPLPAALVAVLREQNGGFLARAAHPAPPNSWASDHVPVESLPGIWSDRPSWHGVPELRALQKQRPSPAGDGLLLLTGEEEKGWVAVELQPAGQGGQVVFLMASSNERLPLASSLDEFLQGLRTPEELRELALPLEEEPLPPPGWGVAALLGSDLDDDEEDDESFAGGGDEEDEEFVDEELLPDELDELVGEQGQEGNSAPPMSDALDIGLVLPPGKKRARPSKLE